MQAFPSERGVLAEAPVTRSTALSTFGPRGSYDRTMPVRTLAIAVLLAAAGCEASSSDPEMATGSGSSGDRGDAGNGEGGSGDEAGNDAADGSESGGDASSDGQPPSNSCSDVVLAPIEDDPDQGFIDITADCVEMINAYRVMDGLEPFWEHEDGICCSALEARQAWLDGTHHNGDYCDWQAQGAAGGGRNPNGTAYKSLEWVPRLFYGEKGDTFEESGGHYQAMMRPEPRGVACGWYGHDRDNHRVVVNYW